MRPLSISPAVRILLVDDHQLVVEGIAAMLRRAARCDVLCSPPDVHPSDSVRTMLPKVVVMELALRRWGSLDELMGAVREICAHARWSSSLVTRTRRWFSDSSTPARARTC
jgi:DNA-binding NarL/FixJ family response regulator